MPCRRPRDSHQPPFGGSSGVGETKRRRRSAPRPVQVIARGIKSPGPYDAGWKDTIALKPAEQARIAVRFTDYAGRFVFHCHNLEHEDMAMMANFVTSR